MRKTRARFGVFFYGTGLTQTRRQAHERRRHPVADRLAERLHQVCRHADAVYGNEAGADNVISWLSRVSVRCGFRPRVSALESGGVHGSGSARPPRGRCGADCRGRPLDNDAAGGHRSPGTHSHIRDRSDARAAAAEHSRALHCGVAGNQYARDRYRMDKVPLPMRPALRSRLRHRRRHPARDSSGGRGGLRVPDEDFAFARNARVTRVALVRALPFFIRE